MQNFISLEMEKKFHERGKVSFFIFIELFFKDVKNVLYECMK